MKALSLRPPVLFCLCMVTALALALSAPPAARAAGHLYIYGGGGGGGGGSSDSGGGGGGASGAIENYDGHSAYGGGGDGAGYTAGDSGKGGGTGGGTGGNSSSHNGGNGTAPDSGGGGGISLVGTVGDGNGGDGKDSGGKGGNGDGGTPGGVNTGTGGAGTATPGVAGGAGGSGISSGGGGGGGGGAYGVGGLGGDGTTFTYDIPEAVYDKLTITGGQGGGGGNSGGGNGGDGGGGGALNVRAGALTVGDVNISGGAGGAGGGSIDSGFQPKGGAGGDVGMTLTDALTVNGDLVISGGAGGNGGSNFGGGGGKGGNAVFTGAGRNVSVAGALTVRSGTSGTKGGGSPGASGGAAGDASFSAATLRAGSIALTKNDGALSFQVGSALVWTGDGAFTLTGGGANVSINALSIDGGTVNSGNVENLIHPTAFSYTQTDITLGAGGATFDTGGGDQNVGRKLIGSGSLTKTGAGTLTLSGANTYTGMTTVRQGVLALGADNALASKNLTLYGGASFDRGSYAHSLHNGSLTVNGVHASWRGDLDVTNATLNFIAPAGIGSGQTMLDVTGSADMTGSAVNLDMSGGAFLSIGTKLSLLQTANGLTADSKIVQGGGIVQSGVTTIYNIDLSTDANTLYGTVTGGSATEQAKALSEGWLGGMALNLQGADLIAGRGMESAVHSAGSAGTGNGFAGFGALSGASMRYDTGSHVDMTSLSLLTGLAWGVDLTPGRLTVGAFFEYGNGSYDTHNSFSNAADVDGDGDTYYLGGGILARMDFSNTGPGRFHAEASARAGKVHNEYDSSDLRDASGRKAEYDSDTPYYGLHFGGGYLWEINDKASLDLYGKYFWTRQQGDSLSLSTGEHLSFDDADSSRLRLGGRLAYVLNEHVAPYVGAAWEHEFDGKARATTNGFDIDAPTLRGDTGIGELGLSLTPSVDLPLTVDLGVQGHVGQRQGVTGSLQVKWEF